MKKNLVMAVTIMSMIIISSAVFAQNTKNDQKKIRDINSAIAQKNQKIVRIDAQLEKFPDYSSAIGTLIREIDELSAQKAETTTGVELLKQAAAQKEAALKTLLKKQKNYLQTASKKIERDSLRAQVKRLETQKNVIFYAYITDLKVPKELSPKELRRRDRGFDARHQDNSANREERIELNSAKREDLVFAKLANNPVYGDSLGFMGIVSNQYYVPVVFRFRPLDGGESRSIVVDPNTTQEEKLIPGKYELTFWNGEKQIGKATIFTVNTVVTSYRGRPCHWWAYQPRYN